MLSGPHEEDGGATLGHGGKCPPSLRRTVKFRQDDPGESDRLVKSRGGPSRQLAHRCIQHEQNLLRFEGCLAAFDLGDQFGIDGGAACRVKDDRLRRCCLRPPLPGDDLSTAFRPVRIEPRLDLLRQLFELVDGRRSVDVPRDQQGMDPLLLVVPGEFPRMGGLALAEESDQHDPLGFHSVRLFGSQDPTDLLVDDPYQIVPKVGPSRDLAGLCPRTHPLGEFECELHVHIRLEKCPLQVFDHFVQQFLVNGRRLGDLGEDGTEGLPERVEYHRRFEIGTLLWVLYLCPASTRIGAGNNSNSDPGQCSTLGSRLG